MDEAQMQEGHLNLWTTSALTSYYIKVLAAGA